MVLASGKDRAEILKLLMERGDKLDPQANAFADLTKSKSANPKGIGNSQEKADPKIAALSAKTRHSVTALVSAAEAGDTEAVQLLLGQGFDINGQNINQGSALGMAVSRKGRQRKYCGRFKADPFDGRSEE
jgi:ankyrin repeat protein